METSEGGPKHSPTPSGCGANLALPSASFIEEIATSTVYRERGSREGSATPLNDDVRKRYQLLAQLAYGQYPFAGTNLSRILRSRCRSTSVEIDKIRRVMDGRAFQVGKRQNGGPP